MYLFLLFPTQFQFNQLSNILNSKCVQSSVWDPDVQLMNYAFRRKVILSESLHASQDHISASQSHRCLYCRSSSYNNRMLLSVVIKTDMKTEETGTQQPTKNSNREQKSRTGRSHLKEAIVLFQSQPLLIANTPTTSSLLCWWSRIKRIFQSRRVLLQKLTPILI